MNDLEKYFKENKNRLIFKWNHYFEIYERHFNKYRHQEIVLLEIGVSQGGSLQMWKNYFGTQAKIYGMDIDPHCKDLEEANIKIFIGSQSDRKFLREVKSQIPPIDILIDDGGHKMTQQITTFEELYEHVKEDGVYVCEDLHTSYWLMYGGGYKRRGTFIEYSKNFIDYLHAYHFEQKRFSVNEFTKSIHSIHYYDSVMVIEKRKRDAPSREKIGKVSFDLPVPKQGVKMWPRILIRKILVLINEILRFFRFGGFIYK